MITVFTPIYNRAYIINQLYVSLCNQNYKNFEWLIIDDGSTDKSRNLIDSFIKESKIKIRYFYQKNGGKHRAINRGVKEAKGELFFIVDSDDFLNENSLDILSSFYEKIANDSSYAGVSGCRYLGNFKNIRTNKFNQQELHCTYLEFRYKFKFQGDMAEAYKLEILKKYPFPEIENENFISEMIVWNRIGKAGYKLLYFNQDIYNCYYQKDGLTHSYSEINKKNPKGNMLVYEELAKNNLSLFYKLKYYAVYWRFACAANISFLSSMKRIGLKNVLFYPIGWFFYIKNR